MQKRTNTILIAVAVLVVVALVIGGTLWCKLYRVVPQPAWIAADQRDNYFYGSVAAENTKGVPYWIWLAMPRMFPEYMPGPGGYAALGMSWEEGREMPVGFAKQRIGYIRVTGNCALCHAMSLPNGADEAPTIAAVVPGQVTHLGALLTFFQNSAKDPRFNADEFLSEIDTATKLSLLDRLLYRYVLIPRTREALMGDPANMLFAPPLLNHGRNPQAPFTDEHQRAIEKWMKEQHSPGR